MTTPDAAGRAVLALAALALGWPTLGRAATPPAANAPAHEAHAAADWAFDRGLYTNDPKTGKRVDQYEHEQRAYRDPYAIFDSPHESYPFSPDPGFGEYPFYNGLLPYYSQHWGDGAPSAYATPPEEAAPPYGW